MRPDTSMKNAVVQISHSHSGETPDMRDDEQRQQRGGGDQAIDPDLAAQVRPVADQPRGDQRRSPAGQIDEWDIVQCDATLPTPYRVM